MTEESADSGIIFWMQNEGLDCRYSQNGAKISINYSENILRVICKI